MKYPKEYLDEIKARMKVSTVVSKTVNLKNKATTIKTKGRHDPCVGIRAVPIAEAMMALVLLDLYLCDKAQNK